MAWCFSTRASVATVLTTHPCVSRCLRVNKYVLWYTRFIQKYYIYCKQHAKLKLHHDDVIKWKHFLSHWTFVRGIHRSPVTSPHKGKWRGALMFLVDLRLNKRLSKQSWGWWFETPSRSLWRHSNDTRKMSRLSKGWYINKSGYMIYRAIAVEW